MDPTDLVIESPLGEEGGGWENNSPRKEITHPITKVAHEQPNGVRSHIYLLRL